ncbi:ABC transporter ATP-binding protein [Candidatus Uabimicrobium sp. HlEnr_7]|uniref:ABC transporter ATP-binding protein n=1 Tax=Candidatus Uabimicrobium helgolandensis TaxID=3095367 RepID=UPI00355813AB
MEVLKIQDLKKIYVSPEGEKHLVIDVPQFVVEEQKQIALQGTSGCGKTTFLNLIAGILTATEGKIFLNGENISTMSEAKRDIVRANNIGYIFQTFNLLQGYTALENLMIAMSFGNHTVDQERAKNLLKKVGLEHRMHYVPAKLSIGQQQRVAVARALINKPKLVLADEPTGNLDAKHAQEALSLVRDICSENGAALLLVSHDVNILQKFDHLQQMQDINTASKTEGHE